MERFLFKIYGRVQGIGYRWFVVEKATKYHLFGWVKNEEDGTVLCAVEGLKEDVEKFLIEIKNGHPCAKVEKIESLQIPANLEIPNNFRIIR